jgi:hypothetical protein
MKAKDIVSGSIVRYKGMSFAGVEATLFHIPGRVELLLAWEDQKDGHSSFAWKRDEYLLDFGSLPPKYKYCWWVSGDEDLKLIRAAKPTMTKPAPKTMKVSEVKSGTRITIALDKSSYPSAPPCLDATSKITGTLFNNTGGSKHIIAWKKSEKAPHASWKLLDRSETFAAYSVPAEYERAYYLCYPDLEVEIAQPANNSNHLGFMLSCIGAGALLSGLSKASTSPITSTQQLPERISQ